MKRATLILFWAHLLTFSRGTWAQAPQQQTPQAPEQRTPEQQAPHEEELPWSFIGASRDRETTTRAAPQVSACL